MTVLIEDHGLPLIAIGDDAMTREQAVPLTASGRWAVLEDEDGVFRIVTVDGEDVTWPEMGAADCQRVVDEHNALVESAGSIRSISATSYALGAVAGPFDTEFSAVRAEAYKASRDGLDTRVDRIKAALSINHEYDSTLDRLVAIERIAYGPLATPSDTPKEPT